MSTILFYIPNQEVSQKINVDVETLMLLHELIATVCQGINAATWTDTIINQVISYIWGGKEHDFEEYYLYPGYTVKEVEESLNRIKEIAENLKWFPYEVEKHIAFTPLKDAIDLYKEVEHKYK
ncbi:hypothetical protein [Tenacibaculum ovolyticum]|uniref:hypothetical protein n=1 Tax=Tenacibaculum ovolyticum TaxID=104270 RepID=UPI0007EDF887|nr:hypothetical protein [Tenacibaculum ovolyticum]